MSSLDLSKFTIEKIGEKEILMYLEIKSSDITNPM
jgi:hypothetical protein